MLSDLPLMNAIRVIIIGCGIFVFGLVLIFQARKTNAKLLLYYGLMISLMGISSGVNYLIDFITILITGNNMDHQLFTYITWTPAPFAVFLGAYVLGEMTIPRNKWYYLSAVLALNMLYLLDLYIFHWTSEVVYPAINPGIPGGVVPPGEGLLNSGHDSLFTRRWWLFTWSSSVVFGLGLLYKNIGTKGLIRKKIFFFSSSYIVIGVSQFLRMALPPAFGTIGSIIYSIIFYTSLVFSYLGLRAEPEERKKKVKKKITTKDSLFRIIQRPEHISEEEVTYYREQKICLICKGKVAGFNIFLCPNCEALYHEDCVRALSTMENACWVCNDPIDKTKPTKPFKMVEEKKDDEKKNKSYVQN